MSKTVVKGSFESSLKRFKNSVAKSGTHSEFKKRQFFSKPGVLRREAMKNAIINSRKNNKKNKYYD